VSKLPGERDAAPARTLRTDSPLGCPLLPGDLLQRLATGPGATLRQYELLLRRLMCVLHPRADAAAGTIHADPQASTQAVEVVLALTDWDRWSKAGFGKEHAWCAVHVLRCLLLVGWAAHHCMEQTSVATVPSAGACSARSLHPACSRKLLHFSRCVCCAAATCVHPPQQLMGPCVRASSQGRPVPLPLLVSVVGLSLRPVFLSIPRTPEVDQCRIRFCSSVVCVPNLVEAAPSAMAAMFRRPRLWATLLPVLAAASSSAAGLPVTE
jgi:hypothetical protein